MKVSRYKFMFVSAFCVAKLAAAYAYIALSQDLDYFELFDIYCSRDLGGHRFDLLNSVHFFLFRSGCSVGKIPYFWLFSIAQLVLLLVSFDKLYEYKFKLQKLLLVALYFSPTILFFSSAPTKDGFFVSITCIGIILAGPFHNLFLLVAGVIKPYLLAPLALRIKSTFSRVLIIAAGLIVIFYFRDELHYLIIAKGSRLSSEVGGVSLGSFVWMAEIFVLATLTLFSRVIARKDIIFVLLICVLASGVSINVASRIFVVSIFYLMGLRLHLNAREKNSLY
jgi:hypothetical protein